MTKQECQQRVWRIANHARQCRFTLASLEERQLHIAALRAVDERVPGYKEITQIALSTLNIRYDRQEIGLGGEMCQG